MDLPGDLRLWPHQTDAVRTVCSYLDANVGPRVAGRSSALVNIPTGGGKTAVIGTFSHWHPALRRVLVLAPRSAIRDQLAQELAAKRGFFLKRGYKPDLLPKRIILLNSASDVPEKSSDQTIFVSTIQLINDMAADEARRLSYDRLGDWCQAIVVDEGHYEPARSWSQSIRGLGQPTILITATPYRNDLKLFQLDRNAVHISRYSELADAGILRRVEVLDLDSKIANDPAQFVASVLAGFFRYYGAAPSTHRKLIIRCRTRQQIEHIGELVRDHPLGLGGVLCLHENFTPNAQRPWEQRQPIDPETPGAPATWVHQHKLLEGVDGPSFRAVAFYGVLGSARALVQQIGRVVRNPTQQTDESALLVDHSKGFLADTWRRFLDYDAQLTHANMLSGMIEAATEFDKHLPAVVYAERQFRRRLQLGAVPEAEVRQSLRLPLRCHLFKSIPRYGLAKLAEATSDRLLEAEFPFEIVVSTEEELIVLFAKLQTSPLLADHYFVERELHAFVAAKVGRVIAALDTSRPGVDWKASQALGAPLARLQMARLLSSGRDTRLVEVNARNASLGPSAIRRRSSTAASLEATPPTLDEFQFVASSITAASRTANLTAEDEDEPEDAFSVRSVGFTRGRVSDFAPRETLNGWKAWVKRLIGVSFDPAIEAPEYLDRYAHPLDSPPQKPWPRTALLDLEEARELFVATAAAKEGKVGGIEIDDTCLECTPVPGRPSAPRSVKLVANGVQCAGTFEYLVGERRYQLVSSDLERLYRYEDGTRPGSLVEHLNASQAFVVVPEAESAIYTEGSFYDPRLQVGAEFDPDALGLSEVLMSYPALVDCRSEKGAKNTAVPGGWANRSVFHWIDKNIDVLLANAELVICDDGTRESCDFLIAGRRNGRDAVVMVHAKASKNPRLVSASALHGVCGQAAKQMGTLALFGPQQPLQVNLWEGVWDGPAGEGRVDRRLRRARGDWAALTGPQIWERIEGLLQRHSTDREVALVLGASLVRDRFFAQARKKSPPAAAIHALHLIRSTMSAVVGGGARLRILCG